MAEFPIPASVETFHQRYLRAKEALLNKSVPRSPQGSPFANVPLTSEGVNYNAGIPQRIAAMLLEGILGGEPGSPEMLQSGAMSAFAMPITVPPSWALTKNEFSKLNPWALSVAEYDNKFLGKWKSGVMTDEGKFITGWDHGAAKENAIEAGYNVTAPLGERSGWRVAGETILQSEFPEGNPDMLHLAIVRKALRRGEKVPNKVLNDYPDIMSEYGGLK